MTRGNGLAPAEQARANPGQLELPDRAAPKEERPLATARFICRGGAGLRLQCRLTQAFGSWRCRAARPQKGERELNCTENVKRQGPSRAHAVTPSLPLQPAGRGRSGPPDPHLSARAVRQKSQEEKPCEHTPHSASLPPCDHLVRATLRRGTQRVEGA